MPAYLQGVNNLRDKLTFVKIAPLLYYGWSAKDITLLQGIGASDVTALGHLSSAPNASIRIFAAKSPKPGRVKKVINKTPSVAQQAAASTFYAQGSLHTAEAEKWMFVKPPRGVSFSNNTRTITVSVKLSGEGYYSFPRNAADVNTHATELGWELPGTMSQTEREKAFSGTSRPRPPRVKKTGIGSFSGFCAPNKLDTALLAGYEFLSGEIMY